MLKLNQLDVTEEAIFSELLHFLLRKNHRVYTNQQVIEKTGVSEELLIKWVKLGKFNPSIFPNLGAPCDRCGELTTEKTVCKNCSKTILKTLEKEEKEKQWFQQMKRKQKKTYHFRE